MARRCEMLIVEKDSRIQFEIEANKVGENPQPCPICSQDRKKKNAKSFSFNTESGLGFCNHCGKSFYKKMDKSFVRPEWKNNTQLSDKVLEWFLSRNISQEVLNKMQITEGKEWMPQVGKEMNVIQFNYFKNGQLINIKSRDGAKNFKLVKDAEKIFYNLDGIKDQKEIYIVEGEIDCLTMIQNGFTNTVSVPNGATKGNNNLDYLDSCWEYFENAEKVYILTDHDEPGENLANELARRIGIEKCYRIQIPFKDVNEQFCKTGQIDLTNQKPFPITGIYSVSDHWETTLSILKNGFPQGWKPRGELGKHISIHPGYTSIITGIPGHGKSEWLDFMLLQLCIDYDIKGAFFTPENFPTDIHIIKMIEKIIGKSAFKCNELELGMAKAFLNDKIFWVYPEEGYGLEQVLNKIRQAVLKYGIKWFVIDPWNKLEHQDDSTNYISRSLDLISNFNKKNGTHAFIVAHPTKMKYDHQASRYEVPGLYDISGSANFYNKADIGISMYKESEAYTNTLYIQKVKFKFWGETGKITYRWDPTNGRYNETGQDLTNWVNRERQTDIDEVPF